MTPERWQEVERVLEAALERAPSERAALLEKECAGDPDLRAEVESLLASSRPAEGFLRSSAFEDAAALFDEPPADALEGRRFDDYFVERRIGSGGMGEVYLAREVGLERPVALKVLAAELARDETASARFEREARLAASLDHPNVCTIHKVGESEGRPFIAMQYVEGRTLRQFVAGRPLKLDQMLSVALQVADALNEAHEAGIIHRDIKAGNVIVTSRGQAKVLDFGLAKLLERAEGEADTHLTVTGQVMGTPASMSPEQARGEPADRRSDIFSFGCVLYEMATGQIPFKGKSRAEVVSALLTQPHTPAAELNGELPPRLSALIDRALAKDPSERYQSVRGLTADLRQVIAEAGGLDHLFSSSEVPRGVLPLVPARRRRLLGSLTQTQRRALAVVSALAVLAIAGGALAAYLSRPAQPSPLKSIAVLPFKPLGAAGRDEALELGMADTLIARLSNVREIEVRPVSAVHKYTGLEQDAVAAGREQRVDAVLDGHIQKSGEKVRVTVRLLRVADGAPLWAERFDAEMGDIFAVQDSISERVAQVLAVRLAGGERERLTRHHTENPEAYRLYLLGRYHLTRLTDEDFLKGRDYFQQAIEKDPNYAPAYAGLADAYQMLGGYNAMAPNDVFPRAKEAAERALKLDEGLAEAHAALGTVKLLHDWDWPGAEREYRRAVELNPSYSDGHTMYGLYLGTMGRFDEAHAEMRRALELDPLSLPKLMGVGDLFYQQRQYDRAAEQYRRVLDMDPNSGIAHWALGNVYVQKGMYEEAVAEYKKSIPLSGDSPDELASLGYAYAVSGRKREARAVIDELRERSKRRYISPTIIAFIHGGLGERDEAFAWLERAYEGRDFILVFLKVDPSFEPLRQDPRFAQLVRRVGLPG